MTRCLLDILPVELFHTIFSYFLAHEILYTFTGVTSYIDAILISYTDYRANFKSIPKTSFDLICCSILPGQIVSLTLSGFDDTPKQCQLFFKQFKIHEFSKIRSLRLVCMNEGLTRDMVRSIPQLNPNCRLAIEDCDILTLISSPLISQLSQLTITDSNQLRSRAWIDVIPYRGANSAMTPLQLICHNAPKLDLLNICLRNAGPSIFLPSQLPQLKRLILKIEGKHLILHPI